MYVDGSEHHFDFWFCSRLLRTMRTIGFDSQSLIFQRVDVRTTAPPPFQISEPMGISVRSTRTPLSPTRSTRGLRQSMQHVDLCGNPRNRFIGHPWGSLGLLGCPPPARSPSAVPGTPIPPSLAARGNSPLTPRKLSRGAAGHFFCIVLPHEFSDETIF